MDLLIKVIEVRSSIALSNRLQELECDDSINGSRNSSVWQEGDWVYLTNYNDDEKLYRMKIDGSEWQKISDDKPCDIRVDSGWIYYRYSSNSVKFCRIRIDGTEREELNFEWAGGVQAGDWIYYSNYSDSRKIYRVRTDGSGRQKLTNDSAVLVKVVDEWVYYSTGGIWTNDARLNRVKIDGSCQQKISGDLAGCMNVVGDWVYYTNYSDKYKLYRIKNDGSGRQKLNDVCSRYINAVGNWVYYSAGGNIFRMNNNDSTTEKIIDKSHGVEISGDWLYYEDYSDSKWPKGDIAVCSIGVKYYRIRIDGTGRELLGEDSDYKVYYE